MRIEKGETVEKRDNYQIQAGQAKQRFLTYDQERLIRKLNATADKSYIFVSLLGEPYRLDRKTGDIQRCEGGQWVDGNSFAEVMTILDLVCDSRENRYISGRWKSMGQFGMQFHQNLLEDERDKVADLFDADPESLHRACKAVGGRAIPGADISYAVELFDGLEIGVQFWHGDDEFYPRLRYLWDENALQYIRYETMYYAVGLLRQRLSEKRK